MRTLLAAAFVLLLPVSSFAHWADLATAEIVVEEREARITLTVPTGLIGFADANHDGRVSSEEVALRRDELETFLNDHVRVIAGREPSRLIVVGVVDGTRPGVPDAAPGTHSTVMLRSEWPRSIDRLTVHYGLFLADVSTASCLATVLEGGRIHSHVLTPERRDLSLALGHRSILTQATSFVALGVGHIVTGYDHMLFLVGLLLMGGSLRSLLGVVTAFTAAHSLTLTLGVLGILAFPARWVESAIAVSIVYVAAENVRGRATPSGRRWLVAFGFGLVHGLGFASVLTETQPEGAGLAVSLGSFNLGVEMGQLVIVTIAIGLMQAVKTRAWDVALRRWVSMGTAAVGLVWLVERAWLGR